MRVAHVQKTLFIDSQQFLVVKYTDMKIPTLYTLFLRAYMHDDANIPELKIFGNAQSLHSIIYQILTLSRYDLSPESNRSRIAARMSTHLIESMSNHTNMSQECARQFVHKLIQASCGQPIYKNTTHPLNECIQSEINVVSSDNSMEDEMKHLIRELKDVDINMNNKDDVVTAQTIDMEVD